MRCETCRIHHQQILYVMATVPFVEHGSLRIVPHARATPFMRYASEWILILLLIVKDLCAGSLQDFLHLAVHLIPHGKRMIVFSIGVEANLRNPVAVFQPFRINLHEVPIKWQPFAITVNADACRIKFLDPLLIRGAKPRQMGARPRTHSASRIKSEAVASQKLVILLPEIVARYIETARAGAVVVCRRLAH